ncbi:HEAT repeat domain-containing protein [Planococcus sp. 1R117A]|uniref:HEAT repeat domain-containing protein n=1 Tax=Planococcus sp. 1R117A TaxID=3447020 RepID=UPI003EDB77B3
MNEKDLLELIKQMSATDFIVDERDGSYTSEDSPSWKAYRKAEQLNDPTVLPFLDALLERSKHADLRRNIYFILEKIGENTGDERTTAILLKWLEKERDRYALESILRGIAEQKNLIDCSTVLKFVQDERAGIRHAAIESLRGCKSPVAEEALIRILKDSGDPYDLTYASSVLSDIGTNKSIPYLIHLLENPSGDVKCSAIWALSEIGDNSLLPVFLEALQSRSASVKGYAMSAIKKHGDETAIVPVSERIKVILKRKRVTDSEELTDALAFLIRFENERVEIQELFNWIIQKKWDFLFEEEKKWIEVNITKRTI